MRYLVSNVLWLLLALPGLAQNQQFTLNQNMVLYGNATNYGQHTFTNRGIFSLYAHPEVGFVVYDNRNDVFMSFTNGLLSVDGITTIAGDRGYTNELVGFWGYAAGLNGDNEVYGAGWNGSTKLPTKNAIYDKIETISGGASLGIVTNGGTGIDNTLSNLTVISSVGTRNALLIKTVAGGNSAPIVSVTNVGAASTHYLLVAADGVLHANGAGITNLGGVKVWEGNLTQTGTSAPTVGNVNMNTLGGTITWAYVSEGSYTGTLTGAFPTASKVSLLIAQTATHAGTLISVSRTDANTISISCFDPIAETAANDQLNNCTLMIRVHP